MFTNINLVIMSFPKIDAVKALLVVWLGLNFYLTFMGPCIANILQYISNKVQLYAVYLYLETALHVSGGTSTRHQERIQLYLQHLVFVIPLLWLIPDAVDTVVCAPDDGWRYHPKHVERFPDVNKLCKVWPCWIYIGIEIFTLACDICSPIVVQLVARRDVDVMPLGMYEDRENRHRKGRNFH